MNCLYNPSFYHCYIYEVVLDFGVCIVSTVHLLFRSAQFHPLHFLSCGC